MHFAVQGSSGEQMKIHFRIAQTLLILSASFLCADLVNGQITASLRGDVRVVEGAVGNGGGYELVVSPRSWALLGFDNIVPDGRTVTGATFTIVPTTLYSAGALPGHGSSADWLQVHQLFSGNAGWIEGTGSNFAPALALPGEVTFSERASQQTPWGDASSLPVNNITEAFDQTPLDSVSGFGIGEEPSRLTFNFDAATAQGWVDAGFTDLVISPFPNHRRQF